MADDNIRSVKKVLVHDAVYWPPRAEQTGLDSGKTEYDEPIQIKCRWSSGTVEELGLTSRDYVVSAQIITDRAVLVGGLLWKGLLENWPTVDTPPVESEGGFEIMDVGDIPDRRGTKYYHYAILGKKGSNR